MKRMSLIRNVITAGVILLLTSPVLSADDETECLRSIVAMPECKRMCAVEALADSVCGDHEALVRMMDYAEAILYDPSSPDADETLYHQWLRAIIERGVLTETEMVRPLSQLEEMSMNAVGSEASDAEVEMADGSREHLLNLLSPEGNTLILFYDPDCDHCDEVIESLRGERGDTIASRIVTVCVEGDSETWREKLHELPSEWIHAYGTATLGSEADEEVYVLRMMPTAYLISSDRIIKGKNLRL